MKPWLKLALAVPAGLLLVGTTIGIIALPAIAAGICPPCYGLHRIAPQLYSDGAAGELGSHHAKAKARLSAVYGALQSTPILLTCQTAECDAKLGGKGSLGVTYGSALIRLAPGGLNVDLMTHEMAHAELHQRVGMAAMARGAVPAWLDEGLAVLISQDARYLGTANEPHPACLEMDAEALPVEASDWAKRARREYQTLYPQAACAALDWLASRGGLSALPLLFP